MVTGNKKKIPFAKLKALRAEHGLSMAAMAKLIGISETTYLAKEHGTREFLHSEIYMIAKHFKLTADEIYIIFFKY